MHYYLYQFIFLKFYCLFVYGCHLILYKSFYIIFILNDCRQFADAHTDVLADGTQMFISYFKLISYLVSLICLFCIPIGVLLHVVYSYHEQGWYL